jgi:hypothetical protein
VIRAALHVHSTYSDGEFTLAELRAIFDDAGCRVIGVVDHAEAFDTEARLARFVDECAALSDDHVTLLPGLEFECHNRLHIVGYGVTVRFPSMEPADIIRHIADHDGISVIAHPKTAFFDWIRSFEVLPDGVEAWNSKYDGRRAPRPETFGLIADLRARRPDLRAFFGIDLHWRNQFRGLHTLIDNRDPHCDRNSVLAALRQGRFTGAAGDIRMTSDGAATDTQLERFEALNRRGRRLRTAFGRAKQFTDAIGLRPPAALKAQLRRLF